MPLFYPLRQVRSFEAIATKQVRIRGLLSICTLIVGFCVLFTRELLSRCVRICVTLVLTHVHMPRLRVTAHNNMIVGTVVDCYRRGWAVFSSYCARVYAFGLCLYIVRFCMSFSFRKMRFSLSIGPRLFLRFRGL